MSDFTSGRAMASRYAVWALACLLLAGPGLALLAAFDATTDGTLNIRYAIFSTHCSLTLMGWCVPVVFGLVFWLFPLLKETSLGRTHLPSVCLVFLVLPALGLGAYLFRVHMGHASLFILPAVWGLYVVAGVMYALIVWQLTVRTLRPTATDVGVQAGAIWLLVVLGIRLLIALGAMATGREDFMSSSDAAVRFAMLFGFIGNTGLALAAAVVPPFLGTPHPRAMVLSSFRVYNAVVGVWCGIAAWVLAHPFSLGRLLLAMAGFGFAWGTIRLLLDLRLFDLLLAPVHGARRLLVRTAVATGGIMMLLAAIIIAAIGIWSAGMMTQAPTELVVQALHLMAVGFFGNLVLALYIPVAGGRSMVHVKAWMAWGAYLLLTAWVVGEAAVGLFGAIGQRPMWLERYYVGWMVGGGMLLLSLWLLSALAGGGRPAAAQPHQGA